MAKLKEAAFKEPQKRSKQSSFVDSMKRSEEVEEAREKRSNRKVLKVFSDDIEEVELYDDEVDNDDLGHLKF